MVEDIDVIDREKRISEEHKKLTKTFGKIPTNINKVVENLIGNAAFMKVTLDDLQRDINKTGTMTKYQNGENQWGYKPNADVQTYNTTIKNYSNIIKQLTDLLPKEPPKADTDKLDEFLNDA